MRLHAIAALAALLIAGSAAGSEIDLRGPAPQAGATYLVNVETKTKDGNLNMSFAGQPIQGTMQTTSTHEIELKMLEVEGGEPVKVQSKFIKAKSSTKMNIAGQQQNQDDTNMQGAVLTQTKKDDKWTTTMEGGNLPQEAKDIVKDAGFVDPRLAFPEKKVNVGDKWKIKDEMMQAFMGQAGIPGSKLDGEIEFKLVEVKKIEGRDTAVIEFKMDMKIIMDMSPQQGTDMNITITLDGKGNMLRDLTDYSTVQEFAGDMDFDMSVEQGGNQMMAMTAKMPFETTSTQQVKK